MKILPRHLLRSFLPTFFLCVVVLTSVLLMHYFLRLFNLAVGKGISVLWVLKCFVYLLPYFLSLAVPMAFLISLLMTLGRFSEQGEVTALRASGFSFREILGPYLLIGCLLSGLLLFVNHRASPDGFHLFRNAYVSAAERVARVELEPKVFFSLGKLRLYAEEVVKRTGALRRVYLVVPRGSGRVLRIEAPEGSYRVVKGSGVELELYRGRLQLPNPDPSKLTTATFAKYRVFVPFLSKSPQGGSRHLDMQEMRTSELGREVSGGKLSSRQVPEYRTEMTLRSVGALSPFVLFWLAGPLGLGLERRSRAKGFALSLLVLFVYYGLLAFGISLGRRSPELSSLAPWLPNVVCLVAGAYFTRRLVAR